MRDFIPQIEPWINDRELFYLKQVVESTYVTEYDLTKQFEERIKESTGSKYVIAYTNGTMALYACFKALGIGRGDKVIVPNMTFVATANAVIMAGATPVFCEVKKDTFCIDVEKLEELLDPYTRAIVPVHLYGQSADMDSIMELAHRRSVPVIEDAAQGVGVKYKNKHVGTFGNMGILSYYGNKTITCGEGGAILTNNEKLAKACYRLKNHGRDTKGVFKHDHIGYNFSFTEMQAAIGLAQMDKLSEIIKRKKDIHDVYYNKLLKLEKVFKPAHIDPETTNPVFWFTSYLTEHKKELQKFLKSKNIATRDFFYPLNKQPCYIDEYCGYEASQRDFSVSDKIYSQGISLPSSYSLTFEEQQYIINSIYEFFSSKGLDA